MDLEKRKVLTMIWVARLMGFGFAIFLALFALDVFSEDIPFLETMLALLMHLLPSLLVICIILVSWQRELIGAIFFLLLDVVYLLAASQNISWEGIVVLASLLLLLSILYYLAWKSRKASKVH